MGQSPGQFEHVNGHLITLYFYCSDDMTIGLDGAEKTIDSNFEIDTPTLKCAVYMLKDYGEPLLIDECSRILQALQREIEE